MPEPVFELACVFVSSPSAVGVSVFFHSSEEKSGFYLGQICNLQIAGE